MTCVFGSTAESTQKFMEYQVNCDVSLIQTTRLSSLITHFPSILSLKNFHEIWKRVGEATTICEFKAKED